MDRILSAANRYLAEMRAEKPAPVWAYGTANAGAEADGYQPVDGIAVVYDRAIHLGWLTVLVRPGGVAAALSGNTAGMERDIMLLHTHRSDRPLGRTGLNTLSFSDGPAAVTFDASLDLSIGSVAAAAEEVRGGLLNHASIGFWVAKGEWEGVVDNCGDPQCAKAGLEISMLIAEEVGLFELSLVPQGACIGTSAMAAARWADMESDVVEAVTEPAEELADVSGLVPVDANRVTKVLSSASRMAFTTHRRVRR